MARTTKDALTEAFQEDVTKAPQATTQQDVEAQDTKTRLWQSLDTTYGAQREQSDKGYDQAIANADRQLLSRGMQRSSYGMQTLANMAQEKVKANSDIMANQIADYQNRINTLEQQEQQFAYQQERDRIADEQWQQSFNAQQEQWKQQFDYNKMTASQQIAYNYLMNMLETGDNPSDALLKQAGISRADYQQMKATPAVKAKSGGGGRTGGAGGNGGNTAGDTGNNTPDWYAALFGNTNNTNSSGSVNTTPTGSIGNLLSVEGASTPKRRDWETSNKPKKQYIKAETTSNK